MKIVEIGGEIFSLDRVHFIVGVGKGMWMILLKLIKVGDKKLVTEKDDLVGTALHSHVSCEYHDSYHEFF